MSIGGPSTTARSVMASMVRKTGPSPNASMGDPYTYAGTAAQVIAYTGGRKIIARSVVWPMPRKTATSPSPSANTEGQYTYVGTAARAIASTGGRNISVKSVMWPTPRNGSAKRPIARINSLMLLFPGTRSTILPFPRKERWCLGARTGGPYTYVKTVGLAIASTKGRSIIARTAAPSPASTGNRRASARSAVLVTVSTGNRRASARSAALVVTSTSANVRIAGSPIKAGSTGAEELITISKRAPSTGTFMGGQGTLARIVGLVIVSTKDRRIIARSAGPVSGRQKQKRL